MPTDRHQNGLKARLQKVIATKAIFPAFQPIVDLQSGEIWACESLSRPKPDCGFDNVMMLFESAEKTDLLWELEALAREKSLDAARGLPRSMQLFLNTTPQVFADKRFAGEIISNVKSIAGLTPDRVVLEITEQSGEQFVPGLEDQVSVLRDHGFQIALDDVGAGASGLNRIMTLRPHWLKLNRALIQNIDKDRTKQNLVRFMQHYTKLTGVKLIAEGIEREEEMSVLIDIGVAFGQGFYLARPGSREQTLDPVIVARMREKWSVADIARFADPRQKSIRRYARAALQVDSSSTVTHVASLLSADRAIPGAVVLSGARVVGWCDRETVLRASRDRRASQPIAYVVSGDSIVISPTTTVSEAMDIAAARPESSSVLPLVIADSESAVGVLTVRDLLQAAAEVCHETSNRMTSLTGLPGRARCDEHLHDAIMRHQGAYGGASTDTDAAVLDIRGMSDYNGAYGYDMGDRLLVRLVGMLRAIVHKGDPEIFLGHLGDDRFVMCGPHAKLQRRLLRLLRQFGGIRTGNATEDAQSSNPELEVFSLLKSSDRLGLRAVLIVDAFTRVGSVRDLHTLTEHLRRGEQTQRKQWTQIGESIMFVDRGESNRGTLRLSA